MANCIIYDKATDQPINVIVANITDKAPEGCYLKLLPDNAYWNGNEIIIQDINDININLDNFIDNSKDITWPRFY